MEHMAGGVTLNVRNDGWTQKGIGTEKGVLYVKYRTLQLYAVFYRCLITQILTSSKSFITSYEGEDTFFVQNLNNIRMLV